MSEIIVGISNLKVSNNPGDALITYARGSCIGVAVFAPKVKVGGLLPFMLPDSSLDANRAKAMPGMIGQKNIMALRKIFWRNNVLIDGEETGEHCNRTVRIELSNGRCILKSSNGTV